MLLRWARGFNNSCAPAAPTANCYYKSTLEVRETGEMGERF